MRPLLFILGWLLFGLGFVGAFVPVLPTTPLMLLALWCFARSSNRFHDWLYAHQVFGPPLQQYREHRVIPLVAKCVAVLFDRSIIPGWGPMSDPTNQKLRETFDTIFGGEDGTSSPPEHRLSSGTDAPVAGTPEEAAEPQ